MKHIAIMICVAAVLFFVPSVLLAQDKQEGVFDINSLNTPLDESKLPDGLRAFALKDIDPKLKKFEDTAYDGLQFLLLLTPKDSELLEERFAFEFARGVAALAEINHLNLLIARHPQRYAKWGKRRSAMKMLLKSCVKAIDSLENKKIEGAPNENYKAQALILRRGLAYIAIYSDFRTLTWTVIQSKGGMFELTKKLASIQGDKSQLLMDLYRRSGSDVPPNTWTMLSSIYKAIELKAGKKDETKQLTSDGDPWEIVEIAKLSPKELGPKFEENDLSLLDSARFPSISYHLTGKPDRDTCMRNEAIHIAWKELTYNALLNLMDDRDERLKTDSARQSALNLLQALRELHGYTPESTCNSVIDMMKLKASAAAMEAYKSGIPPTDQNATLGFMLEKLKPYRNLMSLAEARQKYMDQTTGLNAASLNHALERAIASLQKQVNGKKK